MAGSITGPLGGLCAARESLAHDAEEMFSAFRQLTDDDDDPFTRYIPLKCPEMDEAYRTFRPNGDLSMLYEINAGKDDVFRMRDEAEPPYLVRNGSRGPIFPHQVPQAMPVEMDLFVSKRRRAHGSYLRVSILCIPDDLLPPLSLDQSTVSSQDKILIKKG